MNRERRILKKNGYEVWVKHVEDEVKAEIVDGVARILEFRFDIPRHIPLALTYKGETVGFLDVTAKLDKTFKDYDKEREITYPSTFDLCVELVSIDKRYRGRGLSKLLQDGLLKLLEDRGYFKIEAAPKLEALAITYEGGMFVNSLFGRIRNRLPRHLRKRIIFDLDLDMPTDEYARYTSNANYQMRYVRHRYDSPEES
ncbi:hypothetical protein [Vibrio owensii]|uniref:hypothetical protein n=1 Tax=Vibrio owensii TaxID=696485 RepID=UPI0018F1B312|nr:hypothetical protein [Vibrio owensii]